MHFIPDSKVVDFLKYSVFADSSRLLNDYRRKSEHEGNFVEAKRARHKFEDLRNKEKFRYDCFALNSLLLRQVNNMKAAQEQELLTVENAQKAQFIEFSQAWDNYMSDYEATAYLSLEKLKEKHLMELQQLHEKLRVEYKIKLKYSKELMEMKKRVKVFMSMKRYEDAEELQLKVDTLQEIERAKLDEEIEHIIHKHEKKLREKQQLALSALLKRI